MDVRYLKPRDDCGSVGDISIEKKWYCHDILTLVLYNTISHMRKMQLRFYFLRGSLSEDAIENLALILEQDARLFMC